MSARMPGKTWFALLAALAAMLAADVALAAQGVAKWEVKRDDAAGAARVAAEKAEQPKPTPGTRPARPAPVLDEQAKKIRARYPRERETR